ncbi:FeoA family protein [Tessaracoccus antarcticus]|uniref:Ferrous iron transport protein A n=1 Tax=Tessaracoccus antarcticus TaxID=2479848 RepID=A0A3M0GW47_9ACTN|nr:FeoA family protein [Tessaracoccus antarcticus]RMB61566.1 ferrous iron transport protein A [Tessaracoccus antarcticus]
MTLAEHLGQRQCVAAGGRAKTCSLAELGCDCPAKIIGFTSDDQISRRLFDLGFAPGQVAALVRRAPMRDPMVFNVGGSEIVLRKREASRIVVEQQ